MVVEKAETAFCSFLPEVCSHRSANRFRVKKSQK
jgi:hypothetical protein